MSKLEDKIRLRDEMEKRWPWLYEGNGLDPCCNYEVAVAQVSADDEVIVDEHGPFIDSELLQLFARELGTDQLVRRAYDRLREEIEEERKREIARIQGLGL